MSTSPGLCLEFMASSSGRHKSLLRSHTQTVLEPCHHPKLKGPLMQQGVRTLAIAAVFALFPAVTMSVAADRFAHDDAHLGWGPHVQLGPRPFYLVDKMAPSKLKEEL